MREISYKEGREMERTHQCKQCSGGLVVFWGGSLGIVAHMIKCSENKDHSGELKKGDLIYDEQPIEIKNVLDKKAKRRRKEK